MISCVILHFAEVRERCGTARESVDVSPGATLEDLWSLLLQRHPGLREARLKHDALPQQARGLVGRCRRSG